MTCLGVNAGVWNVCFHSGVDGTCLGMITSDCGPCDLCKGSMRKLNLSSGQTGFPRCVFYFFLFFYWVELFVYFVFVVTRLV